MSAATESAPKKKLRPCYVCGADSRTRVSWPPMKVREHNRCESCWIQWWAFGNLLTWWYGNEYFVRKTRKASAQNQEAQG